MWEGTFCVSWRLLVLQVGGDLAWGVQKGFVVPGGITSPQRRKKWAGEDVSYYTSNPASFTVSWRPSGGEPHTAQFQRCAWATQTQASLSPWRYNNVLLLLSIRRWTALYFRRIYGERSGLEDSAEGRETERSVCFQSYACVKCPVSLTLSVLRLTVGPMTCFLETRCCLALLYTLLFQYRLREAQGLCDRLARQLQTRAGRQEEETQGEAGRK